MQLEQIPHFAQSFLNSYMQAKQIDMAMQDLKMRKESHVKNLQYQDSLMGQMRESNSMAMERMKLEKERLEEIKRSNKEGERLRGKSLDHGIDMDVWDRDFRGSMALEDMWRFDTTREDGANRDKRDFDENKRRYDQGYQMDLDRFAWQQMNDIDDLFLATEQNERAWNQNKRAEEEHGWNRFSLFNMGGVPVTIDRETQTGFRVPTEDGSPLFYAPDSSPDFKPHEMEQMYEGFLEKMKVSPFNRSLGERLTLQKKHPALAAHDAFQSMLQEMEAGGIHLSKGRKEAMAEYFARRLNTEDSSPGSIRWSILHSKREQVPGGEYLLYGPKSRMEGENIELADQVLQDGEELANKTGNPGERDRALQNIENIYKNQAEENAAEVALKRKEKADKEKQAGKKSWWSTTGDMVRNYLNVQDDPDRVNKTALQRFLEDDSEFPPKTPFLGPFSEEAKEQRFMRDYTEWANANGMDKNPDSKEHFYDYRGYYEKYGKFPKRKGEHLTGEFKSEEHPTRYIRGLDTAIEHSDEEIIEVYGGDIEAAEAEGWDLSKTRRKQRLQYLWQNQGIDRDKYNETVKKRIRELHR